MLTLYTYLHGISIHAPHEGERHAARIATGAEAKFQSTLPTRGSDLLHGGMERCELYISIHAPHEGERRNRNFILHHVCNNFNPRSPRGGATGW